jgi:hypothetical protein
MLNGLLVTVRFFIYRSIIVPPLCFAIGRQSTPTFFPLAAGLLDRWSDALWRKKYKQPPTQSACPRKKNAQHISY